MVRLQKPPAQPAMGGYILPSFRLEQDTNPRDAVDAGKSSMLGVLVKGDLDDGRGKARVNLYRHKHEIETGRTSSVGMEIMGFDSKGQGITSDTPGRKSPPCLFLLRLSERGGERKSRLVNARVKTTPPKREPRVGGERQAQRKGEHVNG